MVVKKKQNCGFHGYWIPVIPRGLRSVRRRGLFKKTIEDSQICAFELLAAVAGKFLLESEGSASSNAAEGKDPSSIHSGGVKQNQLEGSKGLRSECLDQGSCIESGSLPGPNLETISREFPRAVCDPVLESTSVISGSIFSEKLGHDLKSEIPENQTSAEKFPCKFDGDSSDCGQSCDGYVNNAITRQLEDRKNPNCNVHLTMANTSFPKDETEICVNTHTLIKSDSSVQLTLFRDSIPNASFPRRRKNVKVGTRDDEKFVGCNRSNYKLRAFRSPRRGQWRIRKLLTSKYWKAAPKLKDSEFSNTDGGIKRISRNRKILHTCETIQREGPFKKRKFFNPSSALTYDQEGSSESISNSPEKGMKGGKSGSVVNKASGVSSSAACHQAFLPSKESHVKFSIKSFKVPELYIEVPETTTVGSLKRTVMEAVTSILRGGLHIGVLLQGNEVKDDNRTLLQTGISRNDYLDALGFTLERSSATAFPPGSPKDPPVFQPCETSQRLTRLPVNPTLDTEFSDALCDPHAVANVPSHVGSNQLSPTDEVTNEKMPDSRALVSIPPISVEALAVVPLSQKTRRSELAQRRIRRPFSVSEVEALVEAIEKLGTGRWRDVKLRAFEDADHRTYVDLKDKWKTLVHTASIAPQQRRGHPVPQDLLDRVLSAHSYWSQHQSKLHGRNHNEPLKISDTQAATD